MNVKFVKNIRITGDLVCLTGLHIGSVKDSLGIGGGLSRGVWVAVLFFLLRFRRCCVGVDF